MSIETEIFKRTKPATNKLLEYGFNKKNNIYTYETTFLNNEFKCIIEITNNNVTGKVIELEINEEYLNFRVENQSGEFVSTVRESYKEILNDIKEKCFIKEDFIFNQSNRISKLIEEKFQTKPEFIFESNPGFGVFKNPFTKKWFSIIMNISYSKLTNKTGEIEAMNIKLDPEKIVKLINEDGFYECYHMNKKSWITIVLDDTVKDDLIMELITESYNYSLEGKKDKVKNEWIIPANPKYYDIISAFKNDNIILWKQGKNIKVNDIVFMYVASPISSIKYRCKVIEINIPFDYYGNNLLVRYAMRIELLDEYETGKYSLTKLKKYDVTTVRGPRYMPKDLSKIINNKKDI